MNCRVLLMLGLVSIVFISFCEASREEKGGHKGGRGKRNKEVDDDAKNAAREVCGKGKRNCKQQQEETKQLRRLQRDRRVNDFKRRGKNDRQAQDEADLVLKKTQEAKQAVLAAQGIADIADPEDNGLWQHDMVLNVEQAEYIINHASDDEPEEAPPGAARRKRQAVLLESFPSYKWDMPIKWTLDASTPLSASDLNSVKGAIADIEAKTCIRFQQVAPNAAGPKITFIKYNDAGFCGQSPIGNQRSSNPIYLNFICGKDMLGVAAHEIMHSLGVHHTQTRTDRDDYITVQYANANPQNYDYFAQVDNNMFSTLGIPYDYYSVLHYGAMAASTNGKPTMVPKKEPVSFFQNILGRRTGGLSSRDAEILRKMYCQPGCTDKSPWCGKWANSGYCQNEKRSFTYMSQNCQKSCEYC